MVENPDLPEAWKVQGEIGGKEVGIGELRGRALFFLVNSLPRGKNAFENFQKIFLQVQTTRNQIP